MTPVSPVMKMSDSRLPSHIQEEIMKRLPVKSLVQFRSVSKSWKTLIDSSEFVAAHTLCRRTQPQHLLLWYWDQAVEVHFVRYIDDNTSPQHRSLLTPPLRFQYIKMARIIGSSRGLLCLYGSDPKFTTHIAVLWNPTIRKYINFEVPRDPIVGFGVCPVTCDPKIVAIKQFQNSNKCAVYVFTLSSGKWHPSNNLPTAPIHGWSSVVTTDRFIYWIAGSDANMILSFDITNEKFKLVDLPDRFRTEPRKFISISKIGESLAVLESTFRGTCTEVWMMEDGVELFNKVFNIQGPSSMIVGFRMNGVPIMGVTNDDNEPCACVVYEPNSKHDNVLEMAPSPYSFNLNHYYMESLLFVDWSSSCSY